MLFQSHMGHSPRYGQLRRSDFRTLILWSCHTSSSALNRRCCWTRACVSKGGEGQDMAQQGQPSLQLLLWDGARMARTTCALLLGLGIRSASCSSSQSQRHAVYDGLDAPWTDRPLSLCQGSCVLRGCTSRPATLQRAGRRQASPACSGRFSSIDHVLAAPPSHWALF